MNPKYQPLYQIESIKKDGNRATVNVVIDPQHVVFDGHFPGHPVMPGVCQIDMIREICEKLLNQPLQLYQSDQIKFLKVIDPTIHHKLLISLELSEIETRFRFTASISDLDNEFLKMKGEFTIN